MPESTPGRFLECTPGQPKMARPDDARPVIQECFGRGVDRILSYAENLPALIATIDSQRAESNCDRAAERLLMKRGTNIAARVVLLVVVLSAACTRQCARSREPVTAGFWFESVTCQLPARETERLGGPIGAQALETIRRTAWAELRAAYSGLRVSFSEDRDAFYRVAVLQDLGGRPFGVRTFYGDAGQSRTLGPLGGRGAVSFEILARNAVYYAPPDASRASMIEAIGKGIGRAAAHEFAHQILPDANIHATSDKASYEYGTADRAAQYWGVLHWGAGRDALVKKLGA